MFEALLPTFSILLPSRDRLDLLKYAIESVLAQDTDDYEIVVSDNASSDDYAAYIASLRKRHIKYLRSDVPLSVTENWNKALEAASGRYVLMLGDDDALTPGLLLTLKRLVRGNRFPEVVYMRAYHYLYPNVSPAAPNGSLHDVANSMLFVRQDEPYMLEKAEAVRLAQLAVAFHHEVSFNAQHFLWRRDFTRKIPHFFRGPYPDYFACFYTFSHASKILVLPAPSIIIGIAKQSFGFFFMNNREEEGEKAFGNNAAQLGVTSDNAEALAALKCPGSGHYRNWLLTALRFQREIDPSYRTDFKLYRKIQIVETIAEAIKKGQLAHAYLDGVEDPELKSFAVEVEAAMRAVADGGYNLRLVEVENNILIKQLQIYYPASVVDMELEAHKNILDAFEHLERLYTPPPKRKPSWAAAFRSWFARL